jgi:hypothetical protein
MVAYSTSKPKIKGLNPTGIVRDILAKEKKLPVNLAGDKQKP